MDIVVNYSLVNCLLSINAHLIHLWHMMQIWMYFYCLLDWSNVCDISDWPVWSCSCCVVCLWRSASDPGLS